MASPTQDDAEAKHRYNVFVRSDPFPHIPAALLNSSDIYNYVAATGMVCPFAEATLKSASCSIHIGRKVIFWGDNQACQDKNLRSGESFSVPANSIVFVTTKEKFRLPDYMAMRFNLKIANVHRGILLGTGPLVDPGFVGHLLIPLHNLTTNSYVFQEGEEFVWAEFTKISPHPVWDPSFHPPHFPEFYDADRLRFFPKRKRGLREWDYLNQASKTTIRSSISTLSEDVKRFGDTLKWSAILGGGSLALAVVTLLIPLLFDLKSVVSATQATLGTFQVEARSTEDNNQKTLDQLNRDLAAVRTELAVIRERDTRSTISALEGRLQRVESQVKELMSSRRIDLR